MKEKLSCFLFIFFVLSFSLWEIFKEKDPISYSERRVLSKFPEYSFSSDYLNKIEKYVLDYFPMREEFRRVKANIQFNGFHMLDNNGVFIKDKNIFKSNYPMNEKSINNFIDKTNSIIDYIDDSSSIYYSIIPDKNYYLEDDLFLKIDYDTLYEKMNGIHATPIELRNSLELDDYYLTDPHWKSEKLGDVLTTLQSVMKFSKVDVSYQKNVYPNFYGGYFMEAGILKEGESLTYLTSDITDCAEVFYLEHPEEKEVYVTKQLKGMDSYSLFLNGAEAYIEVDNPKSTTDKELILFRDSFGSSILPLLLPSYKKIILIDNRYISSKEFLSKIAFQNKDILFLYSTLIVNESSTLKG